MTCQVVAEYGLRQATIARIARAAGYTTGMVAHYYDSKQDIILAALRLILQRIEERLTRERDAGDADLLDVLSEALALGPDERAARSRILREAILARSPGDWLADQLAAARR